VDDRDSIPDRRWDFSPCHRARPALGPTHPPIQWVQQVLSPEVKWPGRETNNSPPSSAEVKNTWSYTPVPPIRLTHVVMLN
jgi:hypothetical protein